MARYIDKEIICESYVHLDIPDSTTPEQIKKIEQQLKSFFDARVKFLLGESVQTQIETEDGSLKVKLTAYAGIVSLLGAFVMKYPEFRDGVKALYEDSKMLAEASNLETIFVTRTPACDRLHAEARTGVIGRVARVVTNIETLSVEAGDIKAPATKRDINRISALADSVIKLDSESRRILEKIQTDEDRFCLAKGLHQAFSQFPEVLPAEKDLKSSQLKMSMLRTENMNNLALSEFQRYTSAVRSAKQVLKLMGVASLPKKT